MPIRLALAALLGVTLAAAGAAPAGATSAPNDVLVPESQLGSSYAAPGEIVWLVEEWSGGSHDIATAFDGRPVVAMDRSGTGSVVNVFRSYGVGTRPTDFGSVLAGTNYSYTGDSVNMQFAMYYTPADPASYGPTGTVAPCYQAVDDSVPLAGKCFTILKFEPGTSVTGAYASYRVDGVQQPYGGGGDAGWWSTRQVGPYSASNRTGTLDQLLAQMADYEIYAIGASVGSGAPAGTSALLQLTFGGTRYTFGSAPTPAAPAAPPAADSAALENLLTTSGVDVAADTARFQPSGATTDLSGVDPEKPFEGSFAWGDPSDAFVDVYSYSTAEFLGSFPIVGGAVQLSGVDISHLAPGDHHLLFVGQTSGSLAAIQFAVLRTLAVSGVETVGVALLVAAPLLAIGLGLVVYVRTAPRRRVAA